MRMAGLLLRGAQPTATSMMCNSRPAGWRRIARQRWSWSSTTTTTCAVVPDDPRSILALPRKFLRDMDTNNFDPVTLQRTDARYDRNTGRPLPRRPSTTTTAASSSSSSPYQIRECEGIIAVGSDNDNGTNRIPPPNRYCRIVWSDGRVSTYDAKWVENQIRPRTTATDKILWTGLDEHYVRSNVAMTYSDLMMAGGGADSAAALHRLYQYGILLVTVTPIGPTGNRAGSIARLAAALGGGSNKNSTGSLLFHRHQQQKRQQLTTNDIRDENADPSPSSGSEDTAAPAEVLVLPHGTDGPLRTLYGTVWSTTSTGQLAHGASAADSAYGREALPLHTDLTYHRDPPGLQIFAMIQPAAIANVGHGDGSVGSGESIFADGFAAAERLRAQHPSAFDLLSQTVRRYRCIDTVTGWHLEASGPVIATAPDNPNDVVMIRHNDLDRLPDRFDHDDSMYEKLAEAHAAWDAILGQDDIRLVMKLQAGDTMVVANQVCKSDGPHVCSME
jgi:alpha-ketoglutarate-dependent taurine dioxygenase